jgi:Fe-S cluster biogenesis protein NfuA
MPVQVIPSQNPQSRIFAFVGKPAELPRLPVTFDSAHKAASAGYYLAESLLRQPQIHSVKALCAQGTDGVEVTLKDGHTWTNGFEESLSANMQRFFINEKRSLYQDPQTVSLSSNFLDEVNKDIRESQAPVFETIREHGGEVRATGFTRNPLRLTVEFFGICKDDCIMGSPDGTKSGVRAELRRKRPYIVDFDFIGV